MLKNKNSIYAPLLVLLLVVASFFVGKLSTEVSQLKKGTVAQPTVQPQATGTQQPSNPAVTMDVIALFVS